MLSLAQLQKRMRECIQSDEALGDLETEIISGDLTSHARMQIHQNNFRTALLDPLLAVFPITSAYVGADFLHTALRQFIAKFPPKDACLSNYGEVFPEFLEEYKYAETIPYIGDIARLEWAIYFLQHAKEQSTRVSSRGRLNENIIIITSLFPLLNLWMAGTGQLKPESVHVSHGAQCVSVVLYQGKIQLFSLSEAERTTVGLIGAGQAKLDLDVAQLLRNKNIII